MRVWSLGPWTARHKSCNPGQFLKSMHAALSVLALAPSPAKARPIYVCVSTHNKASCTGIHNILYVYDREGAERERERERERARRKETQSTGTHRYPTSELSLSPRLASWVLRRFISDLRLLTSKVYSTPDRHQHSAAAHDTSNSPKQNSCFTCFRWISRPPPRRNVQSSAPGKYGPSFVWDAAQGIRFES